MDLKVKSAQECRFDAVSLGEVMLRLDPGEGRIRTARYFRAWEGGGEYNVIRGLRRCFGMRTAVLTAFADNEVGKLMEDFILQGGVDTSFIKWAKTDGIGRVCRNGLNFTERGFGIRGAVGCYGAYRPRTGDDSMCLQQFHRAVGIHLAGDNRAQVVLQVDGVDGSLCTVRMVQNMQFTGKLLVFASVPMKTYADANILEEKTSVLLFPLNVGCC